MSRNNKFEKERRQLIMQQLRRAFEIKEEERRLLATDLIAAIILRSRPLCRRFNGTPLIGVYREIYQGVKKQLSERIAGYLSLLENKAADLSGFKPLSYSGLYALQHSLFREILDDRQLKKLGLTARSFPLNSDLRAYGLNELVKAIELSGRLCRPHAQKFSSSLYQTIYEEAVTETLCYVCLNLDHYDPERGNKKFMNWVNFKLDKTVLNCYGKYYKYAKFEIPSTDSLDWLEQPTASPDLAQILQDYLRADPEKLFTNAYIRNRPDANFARIALAKSSGQSWSSISQQLDIPVPTLSSFYNRWCRRFAPLLNTKLERYL